MTEVTLEPSSHCLETWTVTPSHKHKAFLVTACGSMDSRKVFQGYEKAGKIFLRSLFFLPLGYIYNYLTINSQLPEQ